MLSALVLAAALSGTSPDPLALAIERYRAIETYRVTIRSVSTDGEERMRYYYQKPGFVRMEFIRPHAGAVLVYNSSTQRVRLWPFGAGHFPELNLSPNNPLIRSPHGQRVDHSDIGALLDNVQTLRQGGSLEILDEQELAGHKAQHLNVTGANNFTAYGVHSYELWLDATSLFPVKIISRNLQDAIIETVYMEDAEIDVPLATKLFNP